MSTHQETYHSQQVKYNQFNFLFPLPPFPFFIPVYLPTRRCIGFANGLPTHRWLKGQYVYPLGDILVCLPVRRYTIPLSPIAYQKKKLELRPKCMSFAKRKQDLLSSEQIRSTLIYVIIISFLSIWNIQMDITINHEANYLPSNR